MIKPWEDTASKTTMLISPQRAKLRVHVRVLISLSIWFQGLANSLSKTEAWAHDLLLYAHPFPCKCHEELLAFSPLTKSNSSVPGTQLGRATPQDQIHG